MDIEGNELEDCQKAMAAAPDIQINGLCIGIIVRSTEET